MYDEAKERGNRQALIIEDAETEILKLSRQAVYEVWTKEKYIAEVEKVIKEAKKDSVIADKIEKPLKDYATKMIYKQKALLNYQAEFFASLILLHEPIDTMEKILGDTRKSEGFTRAVNKELTYPQGNVWMTGLPRQEYMKDYMATVKDMYRELVETNAQEDYDSNVSLRNIAEMTVRYEHQTNMVKQMKSKTRLVWIIPHANASERCAKYQGKLYSLDGTEGEIDGIHFKPLEYATDNPVDRYTTKAGRTYQNGCITGFNCRHQLEPYKDKNKPVEIPKEVVEKYRAINDRQRDYERRIRLYKKMAVEQQGTPKGKKYRALAKSINAEYERFSKENGVAFYPDRTKIL